MSHLLEIQDLKVTFGGLDALSGLNFHVDEGEIVSVIGPNGAGKTTFFNAISGLVEATEAPRATSYSRASRSSGSSHTRSPASASPARSRTSACSPT